MKVAIYARVSLDEHSKDDRRYQEPLNQVEPLREWALRMGWTTVDEYIDRGSGADPNRKEFKRMLHDAMLLRFQTILVWKFDRFSREPMFTAVGRVQKLRGRGIGLKSMTESWLDTGKDNPMSDVVLSIMAWASEQERRKISERTKLGIQRRKNLGHYSGGRPRNKMTAEDRQKATELRDKGKSIPFIQRNIGISRKSLKEFFNV